MCVLLFGINGTETNVGIKSSRSPRLRVKARIDQSTVTIDYTQTRYRRRRRGRAP